MRFCKAKRPSEVKGTIHVKEWFSFLCQIPGVSESKAEAIIMHYKSFASLMKQYLSCNSDNERKFLLENIKVGERRLGPKSSTDIFQSIFGLE
jgi:Holliday junction resolvasome RuvABC DNA-binding subunit